MGFLARVFRERICRRFVSEKNRRGRAKERFDRAAWTLEKEVGDKLRFVQFYISNALIINTVYVLISVYVCIYFRSVAVTISVLSCVAYCFTR